MKIGTRRIHSITSTTRQISRSRNNQKNECKYKCKKNALSVALVGMAASDLKIINLSSLGYKF
jgi:hypothetical protein